MSPEREVGLDPILERDEAQLLESSDFSLREALIGEVSERRSAPEAESGAQGRRRTFCLAACELRLSLGDEVFEPRQIEFVRLNAKYVSGWLCHQHLPSDCVAERLPQPRDLNLKAVSATG